MSLRRQREVIKLGLLRLRALCVSSNTAQARAEADCGGPVRGATCVSGIRTEGVRIDALQRDREICSPRFGYFTGAGSLSFFAAFLGFIIPTAGSATKISDSDWKARIVYLTESGTGDIGDRLHAMILKY